MIMPRKRGMVPIRRKVYEMPLERFGINILVKGFALLILKLVETFLQLKEE